MLFASYEDDQDLVLWRLKSIAHEYALHIGDIRDSMTVLDATAAQPIMFEANEFGVRKIQATTDGIALVELCQSEQFDLVVIDNASDCFDGDENHRRQVRQFVRYLTGAVKAHSGALLLLAHIDKNAARYGAGKNSYSGSTGWHNSARSRLALVEDELRQEKLNVGKALEAPIPLAWTHAVPVPAGSSGTETAKALLSESDDAAVLACFAAAAEAGQVVPAAATGPATTWHALSVYAECPQYLKANKARLRESVARLLRAGKIVSEEYRDRHRSPREKLVLAPAECGSSRQFGTAAELPRTPAPPAAVNAQGGVGDNRSTTTAAIELPQTNPADVVVVDV